MAKRYVLLTGSGSWTIPSDMTNNNRIICIGAGGGGGRAANGGNNSRGGGGGAVSIGTYLNLTPSAVAYYACGNGGVGATVANTSGSAGGDTWFNLNTNTIPTSIVMGVLAKGGFGSATGVGGSSASGFGSTTYSGGSSVGPIGLDGGGIGGGSAASDLISGYNGCGPFNWNSPGTRYTAGGGGGGGVYGAATPVSTITNVGVQGGLNAASGNASGGAVGAAGSDATVSGGGGGGGGGLATNGIGGVGGLGAQFAITAGSTAGFGGGGGGGGGSEATATAGAGGVGGLYGGGGGGGGGATTTGNGGDGAPGAIIIEYDTVPLNRSSYSRVETFTTAGPNTWTVPDGITEVVVEVWGGGGCGGYAGSQIQPARVDPQTSAPRAGPSSVTLPVILSSLPLGGTLSATGGQQGAGSTNTLRDYIPIGGSGTGPDGTITEQGGNGQHSPVNAPYKRGGKGGGIRGGVGGYWTEGQARAPGGGGGSYDSGDNRDATSGAGGGYAKYTLTDLTPGTVISYTIGAGINNPLGSIATLANGANGGVAFSYSVTAVVVPTGYDVVPGKPTGPVSMSTISQAFLPYNAADAPLPISISSYYARNISGQGRFGIVDDDLARVLRHGYGIQTTPNYTRSVPNQDERPTSISWGNFKGTFQTLSMRAPILLRADADGIDPPFQTFAQYDCVQYWYTGQPQVFKFHNASVIMIECWGAYGATEIGGTIPGGYARGVFVSPGGGELYVYVGSVAATDLDGNESTGGWNGGGSGLWVSGIGSGWGGAGGGASDVRTIKIDTVELVNPTSIATNPLGYWKAAATIQSLQSRIIVAGGGGAVSSYSTTNNFGAGGGVTGMNGSASFGSSGKGGTDSNGGDAGTTQGAAGGFGYGGPYNPDPDFTVWGGGGGWYGGGSGNQDASLTGSGGGSGYVEGMLPTSVSADKNFGITRINARPGQTGYNTGNGRAPNGLVNIFILG